MFTFKNSTVPDSEPRSLQEALFESAVEYYTSHSKRVRRKKGRYPQQATPLPPGSGPITGRPLRNEGWIVRYEVRFHLETHPNGKLNNSASGTYSTRWPPLLSFAWKLNSPGSELLSSCIVLVCLNFMARHYEDCWEALIEMFSSAAMLPPRTKRWAEARVLADSISFKVKS